MKERTLLGGVILLCLLFLAGCKMVTQTNIDFDVNSFTKAQKIVVHDTAGNEKAVLTEKADIDAFVDAVKVGGWKLAELPEGLTEAGSFTLWQIETLTAFVGEKEAKINEICTFRIYEDGDYLTIEAMLVDVPFAISHEAAEYLRDLAA